MSNSPTLPRSPQQSPDKNVGSAQMTNLYVAGLPFSMKDDQLRTLFEPYGRIGSAKIMLNIHTGQSRGMGFVLIDADCAPKAIEELNGSVFEERTLEVRISDKKAQFSPPQATNKVFIRNVPRSVDESMLQSVLLKYGKLMSCKLSPDTAPAPSGVTPMQVAFLTFDTKEGAQAAVDALHMTQPFDPNSPPLMAKLASRTQRAGSNSSSVNVSPRPGVGNGSEKSQSPKPDPQSPGNGPQPMMPHHQPFVTPQMSHTANSSMAGSFVSMPPSYGTIAGSCHSSFVGLNSFSSNPASNASMSAPFMGMYNPSFSTATSPAPAQQLPSEPHTPGTTAYMPVVQLVPVTLCHQQQQYPHHQQQQPQQHGGGGLMRTPSWPGGGNPSTNSPTQGNGIPPLPSLSQAGDFTPPYQGRVQPSSPFLPDSTSEKASMWAVTSGSPDKPMT